MLLASEGYTITGEEGSDNYRVALDPTGTAVQVFQDVSPATPSYSFALAELSSLSFDALGGNDTLTIDCSNGSPVPAGGLTYNGGEGNNTLRLTGTASGDDLFVSGTLVVVNGGIIAFNKTAVQLEAVKSPVVDLASLSLFDHSKLTLIGNGGRVLRLGRLSMDSSSTLDLADHELIVSGAVEDDLVSYVQSARNSVPAQWSGTGIASSAAAIHDGTGLVLTQNDRGDGSPIVTHFAGQHVNTGDVLVQYTYNGDANLDGVVNADDYFCIDSGYIAKPARPRYFDGDFNYDGIVNADDYFLIDSSYVISAPTSAPAERRYRDYFDDTTGWTGSGAVPVENSTLVEKPDGQLRASLTLQATAGSSSLDATLTKAAGWDLTNMTGVVRFYIHAGTPGQSDDWQNIELINLRLTSTHRGYVEFRVFNNVSNYLFNAKPGWSTIPLSQTGPLEWRGSFDWLSIASMSLIVHRKNADATPAVTFNYFEMFPISKKKLVAMTFDDNFAGQYGAAKYLASLGLHATFYVVPGHVGQPGYLTLAQLHEMQDMGHLIAGHTYTHTPQWSWMPLQQKITEVTRTTQWLLDNGFVKGARIMATPGGYWDLQDDPLIIGKYVDQLRYVALPGDFTINNLWDNSHLYVAADAGATSQTALDKLESSGGLAVLFTHGGNPDTDAAWKSAYNRLKADQDAGLIKVIRLDDALWLDSPLPPPSLS